VPSGAWGFKSPLGHSSARRGGGPIRPPRRPRSAWGPGRLGEAGLYRRTGSTVRAMRRLDDWMRPHDGGLYTVTPRRPPSLRHTVSYVLISVATSMLVGVVLFDRSAGEALPMAVAVGLGAALAFGIRAAARQLRTSR
jgi:hypothetical protein